MADFADRRNLTPPRDWLADPGTSDRDPAGVGAAFLAGATAVGAILRLGGLMKQSLWVDELLTWQAIRPGAGLHFLEQILDTIQGPLYMAVVWPLVRIQDPAWMMRLPAALAGVAAVPLFGWVVGRWWDRRAARLALLLFALNPFLVWYAQEGRGYSFLVLFVVALSAVFTTMVRGGPTRGQAVWFGLLSAAAILSNLSGLFLWAAMGLSVLAFFRPRSSRAWGYWGLAFGLGLVLVLPWLLKASGIWAVDRIVPGSGTGPVLRGETTFTWLALPYSFFNFFFGNSLGPSLRELHEPGRVALVRASLPLLAVCAIPVGLGLLAGLWRLPRRHFALLLWILVPLALLVFLAARNVKPWNPRYVIVVLPWVLALAGRGLAVLPRRPGMILSLLLCALTLWSLGNYYWNGRYAKADIRSAAALVAARNPEQRPVLVPSVTPVFRFYHRESAAVWGTFEWQPLDSAGAADRFCAERLGDVPGCWIVLGREWDFDPGGFLLPALSRRGRLNLEGKLPGVRVYSWSRPVPQGGQ